VTDPEPRAWRPAVPIIVTVISVTVALFAVSGLLVLLFQKTTGPGEVLRDFARLVAEGDCPGSYALLDPSVDLTEDDWCRNLASVEEALPADFAIVRVVLEGTDARIRVEAGGRESVWILAHEERTWFVLGTEDPAVFPLTH